MVWLKSAEAYGIEAGRNGACVVEVFNIDPREFCAEVRRDKKNDFFGTFTLNINLHVPNFFLGFFWL